MKEKRDIKISIEGKVYKISPSTYDELVDLNCAGEYQKQNKLMFEIQKKYKSFESISNFYYN